MVMVNLRMWRIVAVLALLPLLGASALTTNVSTVAELAGAIQFLNARYQAGDELVLAPGTYAVDELGLQYWHVTYKEWRDSNAHIGLSKFTLRGATGNPADVVICLADASSDVGLLYSYSATVRDLTLSNCTCSAYSACANVNGSSSYSNVVVTCCSSRNGGGANSGTWRDCRFVKCRATQYGGAAYGSKTFLNNCTMEDCEAASAGGASYAAILTDCSIRNCSSETGGGASMGSLTNCWVEGCTARYGGGVSTSEVYGGTVTNCTATGNAGGIYNAAGLVRDCAIVGNVSAIAGGGAFQSSLSNCLVACNRAATNGGGVMGDANGDRARYVLTDCVVSNNVLVGDGSAALCGGGAAYATVKGGRVTMNLLKMDDAAKVRYSFGGGTGNCIVEGAVIDGNAMTGVCRNFQGGGDYGSTLTNCTVMNNISATLGSGLCNSAAECCVISNNVSLNKSAAIRGCVRVKGCIVYEGALDPQGAIVDTRIIGYTNGNVIAKGANVLVQEADTYYPGPTHLVISYGAFTNCLFTGQRMTVTYCSLFASSKDKETVLSSCTVASNCVEYTHSNFQESQNAKFTAVNCVFSDNYVGNGSRASDLRTSYNYLQFNHCLIQKVYVPASLGSLVYSCTDCITNRPALFALKGNEPFMLKMVSPALGTGLVEDWMATACDIRGDGFGRLTDNRVNMGCFEGFLPGKGTLFVLR
ncbi:MAG: hypothetical protein MJ240_07220 [Kiritimatiellae bacterium]|nr:hypothetical protein [Kiritimatiellia bacterium]